MSETNRPSRGPTGDEAAAPRVSSVGLYVCLAAVAIAAIVFLSWPELDLIVQRAFYRPGDGFFLRATLFADFFYIGIRELGMIVAVFLIATGVYALCARVRPWGRHWRAYVLIASVFVLGPGLVVNVVFKDNWGRARPDYIVEFGGKQKFTPPLVMTDQCRRNCSFVAGHPSILFAGFALVFLMRRRRALGYAAVLALGGMAGLGRIMEGGHFFSDVIFAGLFVYLVAWGLHYLLYRRKLPERLARWGPGPWLMRSFQTFPLRNSLAVRFLRTLPGLAVFAGVAVAILAVLNMREWDKSIARMFKTHEDSTVTAIFRVVTEFGSSAPWLIASAVIGGYFLWRWRRTGDAAARFNALRAGFVFIAVAIPSLLNNLLKLGFGRGRPRPWFRDDLYGFYPLRWDSSGSFWSMPSGHTAVAFGLATALTFLWPRWWKLWLAYALAVGASRVIVTAHWFSDVLVAGYLAVVVVVILKWAVERRGLRLFDGFNSCYQAWTADLSGRPPAQAAPAPPTTPAAPT